VLFRIAASQADKDHLTVSADSCLVTVITPVYNGEQYLQDCIQSVLQQTYRNIRYFIVDNCSTDKSLEIARAAAAADDRVTVVESTEHVGVIQNWNRSLANLDERSKYIKFVHADDWLFPACIARMVEVAVANDEVALVSAYRLEENRVTLDHLPSEAPLVPMEDTFTMDGRSVGGAILRERASVLGSPSSVLMKTSFLGDPADFYDTAYLHADKEAALCLLKEHDFGFVRQVLVYTRRHNESVTSKNNLLDTRRQENLLLLKNHGPEFLSDAEFRSVWKRELRGYYRFLAANIATGQGVDFWDSHAKNMERAGVALSRLRLWSAFLRRWLNPAMALKELLGRRLVATKLRRAHAHTSPHVPKEKSGKGESSIIHNDGRTNS